MHSHKILTFYVLPFSRYCSSNLAIFLFSTVILPVLWQKIIFWKVGFNLLEKQLIYNSDPSLCFDNIVENTIWELQTSGNFLKVCLLLATLAKFLREKLSCHILGTEGRRKVNFGEVSIQVCQNLLKENRAKKFSTWVHF